MPRILGMTATQTIRTGDTIAKSTTGSTTIELIAGIGCVTVLVMSGPHRHEEWCRTFATVTAAREWGNLIWKTIREHGTLDQADAPAPSIPAAAKTSRTLADMAAEVPANVRITPINLRSRVPAKGTQDKMSRPQAHAIQQAGEADKTATQNIDKDGTSDMESTLDFTTIDPDRDPDQAVLTARWIVSAGQDATATEYQLLDASDQLIALLVLRWVGVWDAHVMRYGQQVRVAAGVSLSDAFRAASTGVAS